MRLKEKVALITGSGSGIGRGIALAMAKEGAHVVIIDVNEEAGKATFKEINVFQEGMLFIKDISKLDNISDIIKQVMDQYGKVDVLVNNAHASKQANFLDTTQDMFDLSFDTGFYPTVHFMQAAYPYLKESQGSVINFASGAGLNGQPTQTAYAAAKEAIRAISRVAANEWGPEGINVNLISPIALTAGVEQWSKSSPALYEQMLQGIPLRRLGDPEDDIGRTAVFLASDDAKYITGQTIMVDGGSVKLR